MPSPTTDEYPKGTEVKVKGERGRFVVLGEKVEADGRTVVTVYGGSNGRASIRSFYKDRTSVRKKVGDVPRPL